MHYRPPEGSFAKVRADLEVNMLLAHLLGNSVAGKGRTPGPTQASLSPERPLELGWARMHKLLRLLAADKQGSRGGYKSCTAVR